MLMVLFQVHAILQVTQSVQLLQLLKTKPGIGSVSGFFLMEVPDCELGENGLFVFADCAVNPDVDSEKLAEIAMLISRMHSRAFVGAEV